MSPNPTVIKESEESEEDRSFWKVLIFTALGAGALFLSFFLFDKFLIEGNLVRLLGSAVFAALFVAFFVIQVFFTKSSMKLVLLSLVQAVAPLLLFTDRFSSSFPGTLAAAFAVFFVFLFGAALYGKKEIANSLNIRFFQVSRKIVTRVTAGILIAFSVQLYLTYFVWGGFNENFSRRLVNQTLAASEPIVKTIFTEVSFGGTVDQFFRTLAEDQLSKIKVGGGSGAGEAAVEFRLLPPAEQERIVGEVSSTLRQEAEKFMGPLNAEKPINGEIFRIIKEYVDGVPQATRSVFSVIVAVLFFFSAKGIVFLFYWLPEFIAFIIFKIAIVTGFAFINLESRTREFILLS